MKKKIVLFFIILLVCIGIYFFVNKDKYNFFDIIDNTYTCDVDKYIIYGNHMNIEGSIEKLDYDKLSLVLKNEENEYEYDLLITESDDKISFKTSNYIDDGIYLDDIDESLYVLLRVTKGEEIKYYSLKNSTKYDNVTYYTITKNDKRNKLDIYFDTYKIDEISNSYMYIKTTKNTKDDVYDIVIDPGHGGYDPGAVVKSYHEADITLDFSLKLKEKLESLGLKVKLTRSTDVSVDAYGPNGSATIPNQVKAKYVISAHLNSTPYTMKKGGVEVYISNDSNLEFAHLLADNIVKSANTSYSPNDTFKVSDGIYLRYITDSEKEKSSEDARNDGYEPYNYAPVTPYYYMVRETGGIATHAYVDGRNKKYDKNEYYDSNIGTEGYLLELGYMTCSDDLNNLVNNLDAYVDAVASSFKEELKLTNDK